MCVDSLILPHLHNHQAAPDASGGDRDVKDLRIAPVGTSRPIAAETRRGRPLGVSGGGPSGRFARPSGFGSQTLDIARLLDGGSRLSFLSGLCTRPPRCPLLPVHGGA
eukprot:scaffold98343_cov23-Tisochrysis_lutea.AAC.1